MNSEYQGQLFRLATVLYADNNYEVAPKTILRKVIESALISNSNKQISTHATIDLIQKSYGLHLDEEEVKSIVRVEKDNFIINEKNGEIIVCLTEKRKRLIESNLSNKTIDFFITEFEKSFVSEKKINVKETIYRFLYELLNTNIESFKKLVNSKNNVSDLINLESHTYSVDEKVAINEFLVWDNNDKNKAIFDISSYAIEYCMISNNGSGAQIHLSNLKNKLFYLDANVIFRAIGVNGENRKKRTTTFLSKFIETNTTLLVSKFSEVEFKETVKFYVDKLRTNLIRGKLDPRIFDEKHFKSLDSFYDFYYKWRRGKVNDSYDLFEGHILTLYESFKTEFKITVDFKIPFDEKDELIEQKLGIISSEISSHKQVESVNHSYNSDYNDACNILLVESQRQGKDSNIFETKYFFISTDQSLRRWDYHRNMITPIVILPSQWLSILLRYINRTNDDFKSFVSFLNMPLSETQIDSEKIHVILAGISEMTENFEQQFRIAQVLVQRKFDGILEKGLKDDEILLRTKAFAKSELEKAVDDLSAKHKDVTEKYAAEKEGTKELKKTTEDRNTKLHELKKEHKPVYVKKQMLKWQTPAFIWLFFGVILVFFVLLQFILKEWSHNYSYKLVVEIDKLGSETQKTTLRSLMYAPIIGIWLIGTFSWKRIIKSEQKIEQRKKYENDFDEKYK